MGPYVGNATSFLIHTLFGLYILIVMLRFLLQLMKADFYNPISQFVIKATQPPLRPLRQYIPGIAGIDVASIVLMLALQLVEIWLITAVEGRAVSLPGMIVVSIAELLRLSINVFFWAIIIQVVISWINPGTHNPVTNLLHSLTEPLLGRARRMLPPMGGFDLSPIPVLIGLQLLLFLVAAPIRDMGLGLMGWG